MFHDILWIHFLSGLLNEDADISEMIITLMIWVISTFETSVNVYQSSRRNVPEDDHFLFSRQWER